MPITIGPKKPMLTAVSDKELEERKECKLKAVRKVKDEARQKQLMEDIREQNIRNEKIRAEQEEQYKIDETELKILSANLDISTLRGEDLDIEEKKEIIKFARMCEDFSISIGNSAKVVAIVKHISKLGEWDKFPLIRAKVEFSRPGTSNITHKGIDPKYYRLVMNVLGSETAGTDARVVKTTSF